MPASASAPSGAPVEPGLVDARFRLLGEHARGGMCVIHAAEDTWLGRRVALKTPRSNDPAMALRVLREASVLSRLDHPLILPVYHSGKLPSGAPYFVTRLVAGETLEQRARRDPTAWRSLLAHVADAAEAVAFAHSRGVVHRDLKPDNVLVDSDGRTIVIDWGLARELEGSPISTPNPGPMITAPGSAVGTPGYWAPEQRAGADADPRADVYSLGTMVRRVITGEPPDDLGLPWDPERELAVAPPEVRALAKHATEPHPAHRLASAAELADGLRRCVPRSGATRPSWRVAAVALGAVALAGAGVGAWAFVRARGLADEARRALLTTELWQGSFKIMVVHVDGDQVRGVYAWEDGVFEGTLDGRTLKLRWCEAPYTSPHDHGPAELTYAPEAPGQVVFRGWYEYAGGDEARGVWDIAPLDKPHDTTALRARLASWTWRCPR